MRHSLLLVSWHYGMELPYCVYLCRIGIDQTRAMSELPPGVQELISTPTREKIFKMIASQPDGFTLQVIHTALINQKVDISLASVQNILKSLSYRGYLKVYTLKETKTRGRSTVHYKKAE